MRELSALGLPPPAPVELSPMAERAIECWNFCGGWEPQRWPIYAALHPVDDWYALVDLMQVIRGNELSES